MPKKTKTKTMTMTTAINAKRTPEQIQEAMDRFAAFVRKNPGLRIEQINAKLGTTTKDLMIPVRKLINTKVIRTKGEKRATTYEARR